MTRETPKEAARRLATPIMAKGYTPQALHEYTDSAGQPLYWRIRARNAKTGDKWIRPMHLNGQGYTLGEPVFQGGKPLYRLQALKAASEVWFVEGESCADALARLGLPATTSGGASSDETADFSPLAGKSVRLWPDNDESGKEHLQRVANKLRALGCTVSVVDVAALRLPAKGDCVDWLAAHPQATVADVQKLPCVTAQFCASDGVVMLRADTIQMRAVDWLWPGFLPAGMLAVLAGEPGCGKTTIALSLAATVTTGGVWPDGSTCGKAGDVIVWSGEDDPAVTLVPRLKAAGAHLKRVHFVSGILNDGRINAFDPAHDLAALKTKFAELPAPRLLIVDPIVNAVAGDGHKSNDVRRGLQPLVDLAQSYGCAVLGISHFSKGSAGRNPTERVTGSLAYGALARMVLVAAKGKEVCDTEQHSETPQVFMRAKSNIGPDSGGFEYQLERKEVAPGIEGQFVQWGKPIEGTAREVLGEAEADGSNDSRSERTEIESFLRESLASGSVTAKQMQADANGAGFQWHTVKRVAQRMGIERQKTGFKNGWEWALPAAKGTVLPEGNKEYRQENLSPSAQSVPFAGKATVNEVEL